MQLFPLSTLDANSGYSVQHVFGFVEELVVADDPEFEWTTNFNQVRAIATVFFDSLKCLDLFLI